MGPNKNSMALNMSNQTDDFGSELVRRVYDKAVEECRLRLSGHYRSAGTTEMIAKINSRSGVDAASVFVEEAVTQAIFQFLQFVEEEEGVELRWKGIDLREASDGLTGELLSEYGWITRFSRLAKEGSAG